MKCELFAPGSDARRGHPTKDQRRPLESFLVDNQVYYKLVIDHLRGSKKQGTKPCDKCNPAEILQVYLDRRLNNPKFKGQTSRTLMLHAEKFRPLGVPSSLILQFAIRSGDTSTLVKYGPEMTEEELVKSLLILRSQYVVQRTSVGFKISELEEIHKSELLYELALAIDHMKNPESDIPKIIEMASFAIVLAE